MKAFKLSAVALAACFFLSPLRPKTYPGTNLTKATYNFNAAGSLAMAMRRSRLNPTSTMPRGRHKPAHTWNETDTIVLTSATVAATWARSDGQ